jgi:hypothetical protein
VAVRGGGGGVTVGATTTTAVVGSVVIVSSSSAPRLSQVVIGHWRWWRGTPRDGAAHGRRGATHQGGSAAEGGWVGGGRPLGFENSGSKKEEPGWQTPRVWE